MSTHEGHRQRLREQLYESGLESFSEVQKLELMLTFVISRRDTNPIAHALLDRFGSLANVLDADPADLQQVDGVGVTAAAFLHTLPQLLREYEKSKNRSLRSIANTGDAARYLEPFFKGMSGEAVYMVCLNAAGRIIDTYRLSDGDVNSADFSARSVAERALIKKASSVILSHNHVAGNSEPSEADLQATESVRAALSAVSIHLADHIIITGPARYTSFLERGLL